MIPTELWSLWESSHSVKDFFAARIFVKKIRNSARATPTELWFTPTEL